MIYILYIYDIYYIYIYIYTLYICKKSKENLRAYTLK